MTHIAEIELSYHSGAQTTDQPIITNSQSAYELLLQTWDKNKLELQEQFRVMLLDRKNACMGVSTLATGGISGCLVDLKLVFALALKARASSIIVSHNHPSGNRSPSEADKSLTERFAQAGKLLEMPVLDHLIITPVGYTSFADEGLMP